MKTLIATPAYGGNLRVEYTKSLVDLVQAFTAARRDFSYITISSADIVKNRNVIASMVFGNPEISHLLFIDGDMCFTPQNVLKLFHANVPLVGHIYPQKRAGFEEIISSVQRGSQNRSIAAGVDFVVGFERASNKVVVKPNGLIPVRGLGMGLCLIQRDVLARMVDTGKIGRRSTPMNIEGYSGPEYSFFDQLEDDRGDRLSEDFSFCHRWSQLCDGKVWGIASDPIGHVGSIVYSASYGERLAAGKF